MDYIRHIAPLRDDEREVFEFAEEARFHPKNFKPNVLVKILTRGGKNLSIPMLTSAHAVNYLHEHMSELAIVQCTDHDCGRQLWIWEKSTT